jgi:hypothetical protein
MSDEERIETNEETFEEEEFNEVESLKLAQRFQKDKKFQEAADIFSELCEYRSVKYGEESYEVADMYYLYGDVLLSHCLSNEGKLFSFFEKKVLFNKVSETLERKTENKPTQNLEEDDDLDACWRSLEMARIIYTKEYEKNLIPLDKQNIEKKLFQVNMRIAEFLVEQDEFKEGIKEYQTCLNYTKDEHLIADM